MVLGLLDLHRQEYSKGSLLTPYINMNSKCINGLNLRSNTLKVLDENFRETL